MVEKTERSIARRSLTAFGMTSGFKRGGSKKERRQSHLSFLLFSHTRTPSFRAKRSVARNLLAIDLFLNEERANPVGIRCRGVLHTPLAGDMWQMAIGGVCNTPLRVSKKKVINKTAKLSTKLYEKRLFCVI